MTERMISPEMGDDDRHKYPLGKRTNAMTVTTEEVAARWPALLEKIAEGENITITRQGVPFASVLPMPHPPKKTSAEAVDHLLSLRNGVRLNGLSVREMINEGRKE